MDGMFVAAGIAVQLSFAGPGPGPVLPSKVAVHGAAQAVSWATPMQPAAAPTWAFGGPPQSVTAVQRAAVQAEATGRPVIARKPTR